MGLGGTSLSSLLIILAIVVILFGTKRLRSLGEDVGSAVRGFRKGLNSEAPNTSEQSTSQMDNDNTTK